MLRLPAVAGQFYIASPEKLKHQVAACLEDKSPKQQAIAVVSPHAGLIYSGKVAGKVYSSLILPRTFILIGPNHTGLGAPVSVFSQGTWQMPQGTVTVDETLANQILERFPEAEADTQAHQSEHCLEVQLPFLQLLKNEVRIVPIVMMQSDLLTCQELGSAIAAILREWPEPVLLIASTDMTHYEPDPIARQKDGRAIEKILSLDPQGLHTTVHQYRISMCGHAPTVAVLFASLELGASQAELVHYMTSAEVSGDYEHVVGYAGIIIK
jgi:AmmeMemoRadiSam system protein B